MSGEARAVMVDGGKGDAGRHTRAGKGDSRERVGTVRTCGGICCEQSSLCLLRWLARQRRLSYEEWVVPTGMPLQPPLVAAGPIIRASSRRSFSSAPTTAPLASREPLLEVVPGSPSIPVDALCCMVLAPGVPATLRDARAPSERSHRPAVPAARGGDCSVSPCQPAYAPKHRRGRKLPPCVSKPGFPPVSGGVCARNREHYAAGRKV